MRDVSGGGRRLTTQWSKSLMVKSDDDEGWKGSELKVRCVCDREERTRLLGSIVVDVGSRDESGG